MPVMSNTAPLDENDRPLLTGPFTGVCPQCDMPLDYAEFIPHSHRFSHIDENGTAIFDSSSSACCDAAEQPHLFCPYCVIEYSLDGIEIEFD